MCNLEFCAPHGENVLLKIVPAEIQLVCMNLLYSFKAIFQAPTGCFVGNGNIVIISQSCAIV